MQRGLKPVREDLTGQTIGRWFVIERVFGPDTHGKIWRSRCTGCGVIKVKSAGDFSRNGHDSCWDCKLNQPNIKRPYEALYNGFVARSKNRGYVVAFSFDEFVALLVSQKQCHYCTDSIRWSQHGLRECGSSHHMDRKDHSGDYTLDNVVVACSRCNYNRGSEHCESLSHRGYTYEQWYAMTECFRSGRMAR